MQPASGLGSGGEDAPPPPGDEDAPPPPDDSDAPDWVSEELPAQAQQKPKPAAPVKEWPGWPQLLEALQDRVSIAVRMNLQLSGKAVLTDAGLTVLCDDEVTQNLAKSAQQAIDEAAAAVLGRAVKVKIRLADAQAENNSALDEIVELAHKLDIEVTEF